MPILHWLDREQHVRAAESVPYRLLEADDTHSAGDPASPNMLIQGDNLDALKALLPYYAGRIKCVYIDPPYNTRSAFEHYDDNLEHSQWLSLMYPRLSVLRNLLSEDGSIWISIDSNESHYLKIIMDELFGRKNYLTEFVWKKSYGGGAKARWFVGMHEYILCYAKNINNFPDMFLPPDSGAKDKYYKYKDDNLEKRGPYRLQPLATTSMDDRPNLRYPIQIKDGPEIWPEKQWQWSKERVDRALINGEIVVRSTNKKTTVSYKQYLRDPGGEERRRKPPSIIEGNYTQHGTYEGMAIFGLENKFAFPKPEGLLNFIFEASTSFGDLVLDSFLGSGTTAAVAHKMGRRYIGIEMGDHAVTHCVPRLRKVIDGEQGGISKSVGWAGGGGFRFYRLGEPVFDPDGRINPAIPFTHLAAHVWFAETSIALGKPATTPLLGIHDGTAIYLLYNGVLGDKRPHGGNVLTAKLLAALPPHPGPKIIYGEATRLSPARLKDLNIVFRQTPYDLKIR